MLQSLIAAAEAEHELAPLLMHPLAFAGIAVAVFVLLGYVTWSFRDVANRHSEKWSKTDSHTTGH
jgi:heme/copper-type cytochrome/quinol oxidase subunit 2